MSTEITLADNEGSASGVEGAGYVTLSLDATTAKIRFSRGVREVHLQGDTDFKVARVGTAGDAMGGEGQVAIAQQPYAERPIPTSDHTEAPALYLQTDTAPTTVALSWYASTTGS
ncbi:MAG: hypothetical protein H6739_04780 [Alphaproteobacteria bacterium]|nr:hypothetical protein [Alphaproteobacteria bacterium]